MLTRAFLGDTVRPAAITVAAVAGVAAVIAGLRTLQAEGVAPGPAAWLALMALAAAASLSIAVPAAGAVGGVTALARWVEQGAWTGAVASGVAGRRLAPAALIVGLVAAGATTAMTLAVEPAVRRAAHRVADESVASVVLTPGQSVSLGRFTLRADAVDATGAGPVFLAAPGVVGSARHASTVLGDAGPELVLDDGALAGRGWRVTWRRWAHDVAVAGGRRIELDERGNGELAALADQTEADGRDASYERAVLYKRGLHPLAALLLPLAVLPLGARRRPAVGVGAVAVGYLVAVRLGDQLAPAVGPWAAASTGPVFVALVALVAWAAWSER